MTPTRAGNRTQMPAPTRVGHSIGCMRLTAYNWLEVILKAPAPGSAPATAIRDACLRVAEQVAHRHAAEQARIVNHVQVAPRSVRDIPSAPPLRFPHLDGAALEGLPCGFEALAEESVAQLAADLAHQGARGPTARQSIANDAAISIARLRCFQSLQAVALGGGGDDLKRRVLDLERLIEAEHRRWMAALDMLARMDPAPASVRITANQAAIQVNTR